MSKLIWRAECFEAYGLNKFRNFMVEHVVNLDSNEALFEFINQCLMMHGCENSAIFMIDYYDGMWVGIKLDYLADDSIEVIGRNDFDVNWFAEIDSDYRLCCYGLMIEIKPGVWKIINA